MRFLRESVSSFSGLVIFFAAVLSCTAAFAATPDRIIGPIDASRSTALAKSLHPKAQPQYDQGPVEPSFRADRITMFLAPSASQQKALDLLLAQQQDRTSHNYHQWLTAKQFGERFGVSRNDMAKITSWLTSEGFQILSAGDSRNSVIFSGTAAEVQSAFGTEIHRYNVNGETHIANSGPVMLPAALNGVVSSVMGLHDFHPHPVYSARHFGSMHKARAGYYDQDFEFPNFLAPGDIATIYDIGPLYAASPAIDGTGQKLVILGQTDIALADINDFRTGFGLSTIPTTGTGACTVSSTTGIVISPCNTTNFQYMLLGTDPNNLSANDIGEADLDIEWSGAVARNAQIIYINAETTNGVFDGLTTAIPSSGSPLGTVISASYGACEAQAGSLETVLEQGNAEGVTILNSSGDDGAAACDYNPPNNANNPPFSAAVGGLGVSYPASSPEVTGVGGTGISLADDTAPSSFWSTTIGSNGGTAQMYIPEIPWNDDEAFAQFCQSNSTTSFCEHGGSPAVTGWVAITSAATAQEDIWISSTGGGASNCFSQNSTTGVCDAGFPQPAWQQKLSVSGAPASVRYVPDVSLFASPDFPGYVYCTPQSPNTLPNTSTCAPGGANGIFTAVDTYESIVGGTSASTPVFAGIVTLLNQYLNGTSSTGLGNINPILYQLAATPSNKAFHRITSGDNNVYCQNGDPSIQPKTIQCPAAGVFGYSATKFDSTTGYNLVNGLGSVDADALALAWKSTLAPDFQLTAGALTPTSVAAGQSATTTLTIAPISGSTATVVNFSASSCTGLPTGATCSFSPASVTFDGVTNATTQLTITTLPDMAASGPTTVTITPSNSSNVTTTISLTVTATTETFTIAPSTGSFSVTAGTAASVPIPVSTTTGFTITSGGSTTTAVPLTYSCSGLPLEANCNFSPATTSSSTSITLSVTTTAPTARLQRPHERNSRIFYAALLPGLFGIIFAAGSRKGYARGLRMLSLIVALSFSTLWLGSCGGSSSSSNSNPGTPAGSSTITVSATTGGGNPIASNFKFTLVVSQ